MCGTAATKCPGATAAKAPGDGASACAHGIDARITTGTRHACLGTQGGAAADTSLGIFIS